MENTQNEKTRTLKKSFWKKAWEEWGGLIYMLPVLLGIVCFTVVPMFTSLNYAFHEYDPYAFNEEDQLTNFGFHNFIKIFTPGAQGGELEIVMYALFVTFRFTILNVALGLTGSYILALFLNQKTKGIEAFRVVYYLPCLIPGVAGTLLWMNITMQNGGYINLILEKFHIPAFSFYEKAETVLPTLLFVSIFTFGGNAIMWLAQMKNVPTELYESADLDGANYFHKLFHITIPQTTSMIFYLLIMSIIGGLQAFGNVYPLVGVAGREVEFIGVKIYQKAYESGELSMACALSWVLFVIIGIFTAFIFKTSKWVYYGEEA